jgi:hypothetical protein
MYFTRIILYFCWTADECMYGSFRHSIRADSSVHWTFCPTNTGRCFTRDKSAEAFSWSHTSPNTSDKNTWKEFRFSPHVFLAWHFIKYNNVHHGVQKYVKFIRSVLILLFSMCQILHVVSLLQFFRLKLYTKSRHIHVVNYFHMNKFMIA